MAIARMLFVDNKALLVDYVFAQVAALFYKAIVSHQHGSLIKVFNKIFKEYG